MSGSERRKSPRLAVDLPVRCRVEGRSFPARLKDICRDAALIEAHEACPVKSRVVLTVNLPGAGAVEVTGRVIRLTAGEGDARGMAVLFTEATPAAATRIDLFLSRESGGKTSESPGGPTPTSGSPIPGPDWIAGCTWQREAGHT